ncbi:hypothetical protein GT347_25910 [Xylophilus rhododendri]|uniref:Tyrosine specific protein phosphatases domain-containing protein n=1 Tax=Xylophilus rhododendri TaxID=2697032 RepID=A0A857JEB1_9BURK|nr:hypothetical protein GT347_25910 [Xylophilus rhododendri]
MPEQATALQGATGFARKMAIRPELQTVHGGDLQELRYRGRVWGTMTRYPETTAEFAALLDKARRGSRHVINLMNAGDMGIRQYQVEKLPERQWARVGHLKVCKISEPARELGSNGFGRQLIHEPATLLVYDPLDPKAGCTRVQYDGYRNWRDRSTLPDATFAALMRSQRRGRGPDRPIVHCAGGIGRTLTVLVPHAFADYLAEARRRGHMVTHHDADAFITGIVQAARDIRGNFVLPDEHQRKTLYRWCEQALARHQRAFRHDPRRHGPTGRVATSAR